MHGGPFLIIAQYSLKHDLQNYVICLPSEVNMDGCMVTRIGLMCTVKVFSYRAYRLVLACTTHNIWLYKWNNIENINYISLSIPVFIKNLLMMLMPPGKGKSEQITQIILTSKLMIHVNSHIFYSKRNNLVFRIIQEDHASSMH